MVSSQSYPEPRKQCGRFYTRQLERKYWKFNEYVLFSNLPFRSLSRTYIQSSSPSTVELWLAGKVKVNQWKNGSSRYFRNVTAEVMKNLWQKVRNYISKWSTVDSIIHHHLSFNKWDRNMLVDTWLWWVIEEGAELQATEFSKSILKADKERTADR